MKTRVCIGGPLHGQHVSGTPDGYEADEYRQWEEVPGSPAQPVNTYSIDFLRFAGVRTDKQMVDLLLHEYLKTKIDTHIAAARGAPFSVRIDIKSGQIGSSLECTGYYASHRLGEVLCVELPEERVVGLFELFRAGSNVSVVRQDVGSREEVHAIEVEMAYGTRVVVRINSPESAGTEGLSSRGMPEWFPGGGMYVGPKWSCPRHPNAGGNISGGTADREGRVLSGVWTCSECLAEQSQNARLAGLEARITALEAKINVTPNPLADLPDDTVLHGGKP